MVGGSVAGMTEGASCFKRLKIGAVVVGWAQEEMARRRVGGRETVDLSGNAIPSVAYWMDRQTLVTK